VSQSLPAGRVLVEVFHALASMQSGELVECDAPVPARLRLEELAATLPSLFGAADLAPLERVLGRFGSEGGESLREVLLVSGEHVHVMKPLSRRRGVALIAMSTAKNSIGLVLSAVHQRAAELEGG
jgi:hypothetical protein